MSHPKLMVLGAGNCQVPIIMQGQKMGFYVIAVSISGDYPGFSIADKSYEIDVRNKEEILRVAKKERINGVLTDQTDISVPTVAYVAERMGLPGIGYNCALRFTDKFMMRQSCEENGVPVPKHFQTSSLKDAKLKAEKLGFPIIVKPVDNQGSRGISRVDNPDDFKDEFLNAKSYSRKGFVIIEELWKGREIVVEGFAYDFEFLNLIIGDSYNFTLSGLFIPNQRIFPTNLKSTLKQKVLKVNQRLIKGMGLKFGITHSEYLVNEDTGEIRLVEVAARGGGVFISSDLIPLTCGINANELLIKTVIGEPVSHDWNIINRNASAYICFYLPEGEIRKADGIDIVITLEEVHKAFLDNITVGRKIKQMSDKTMRYGPILIKGESRQAIQETINKIQQTLIIEVETSTGVKGIVW